MTTALLDVKDLACRRGGRAVFSGLSFSLSAGAVLALTGRNGSGKTTLLRALALLGQTDAGIISWGGTPVRADRDAWRARIAWLGHLDGLKGDLTATENIAVAGRLRGQAVADSRIAEALAAFDLAARAHRPVRTLSAGLRRRVALARVVASEADVWLLDEPFNALDAPAQAALRSVLSRHMASGGIAIAATHVPLNLDGAQVLELGT